MLTTLLCAARVSTVDFVSGLIVTDGVLALLELPELLDSPLSLALSAFSALLVLLDALELLELPEPLELLELPELLEPPELLELPELLVGTAFVVRTRLLFSFVTVPLSFAVTPTKTSTLCLIVASVSSVPPSFLMR